MDGTFENHSIVGWQPAIPLPYFAGRKFRCTCKGWRRSKASRAVTFKTMIEYETHYFKAHIAATPEGETE